jgi:outer membrane lipoprotein-sorting protein
MVRIARRALLALLALALLSTPALAAKAKPWPLTPQDKTDLARIETYFDGLKTLTAKFLQVTDMGAIARGAVFIQRPGKMRFDYAPPSPVVMVADGSLLTYHDRELNETTALPLSTTPVAFLLREKVRLSQDITVTRVDRGPGVLRVSVRETDDTEQGELTLQFSEAPFRLEQWSVLDSQNRSTRVTLIDARTGDPIDAKVFEFRDPKFFNQPVERYN